MGCRCPGRSRRAGSREGMPPGRSRGPSARLRMSRWLKVGAVVFVALMGLAGGGTAWLKARIQTPGYCSSCHIMEPYYNSWKSSAFPAHTHEQAGMVCQDCHEVTMKAAIREIASNVTSHYHLPL